MASIFPASQTRTTDRQPYRAFRYQRYRKPGAMEHDAQLVPSSSQPVFIYGLVDPRTERVRYVGKANNPKLRLAQHLTPAQLAVRTRRTAWLRGVIAAGERPGLVILEETTAGAWRDRERFWIATLPDLTNGTAGGDGLHDPSQEVRAKLRAAALGHPAWNAGRKMTDEEKAKYRAAGLWDGRVRYWAGKRPDAAIRASVDARVGKPSWNKGVPLSRQRRDGMSRDWIVTTRDGREIRVRNLKAFCRDNGLTLPLMSKVAHGHRPHHRGWKVRAA